MKKLKLGVVGSQGRMGRAIQRLLQEPDYQQMELVAHVDRESDGPSWDKLFHSDVVIDFSSPEALMKLCQLYSAQKKTTRLPSLISGTTGISQKHHQWLKKIARRTLVVYGTNMSPVVLWLQDVLQKIPKQIQLLKPRVTLEEIHHIHKKDAPSGTALSLEKALMGSKLSLSSPINSVRRGEECGTHTVQFTFHEEMLSLSHQALSRDAFARGALDCAQIVKRLKLKKGLRTPSALFLE